MRHYDSDFNSPQGLSDYDIDAKNHALVAYILMILGVFTGVLWIVGALWAMVKVNDARGSLFEDHYQNIISVFWWGFVWGIIGFALAILLVGYIIIALAWLWAVYRIILGLVRLNANRPYYCLLNPDFS
ncbi:DUF4870 family protein [Celerinatantimonas yamalensis]|uniref:Yip1 domain-containing protein n=1 Tax=Celerinatantimonas yamalensis TaxID=559956 RepID=A0ABW9G2R3_9GAMM